MAKVQITEDSTSHARLEADDFDLGDLRRFVAATSEWPDRVQVDTYCTPSAIYKGYVEATWVRSRRERKA